MTNTQDPTYKTLVSENEFILKEHRDSDAWSDFVEFITERDADNETRLDNLTHYVNSDSADLSRKLVVSMLCEAFIQGYDVGEAIGSSAD